MKEIDLFNVTGFFEEFTWEKKKLVTDVDQWDSHAFSSLYGFLLQMTF